MPVDLHRLVQLARQLAADQTAVDDVVELAGLALDAADELDRLRAGLARVREYATRQEQTCIEQGLEGQARTWRHVQAQTSG